LPDYTSNLIPKVFEDYSAEYPDTIKNGALASAQFMQRLVRQQQWLTVSNLDATNFVSPGGLIYDDPGMVLRLWVPPYCSHVGFRALISSNFDMARAGRSLTFSVSGGDSVQVIHGGTGSYGDPATWVFDDRATWVYFSGFGTDAGTDEPRALEVKPVGGGADDRFECWKQVDVDVEFGRGLQLWQGYYYYIPRQRLDYDE